MIVVIDGPAGSGKSSTARAVAVKLGIQFIDSGALYRVATLLFLKAGKDYSMFFELLEKSKISFYFRDKAFFVELNGKDVTEQIREMKISENVSEVASDPKVRAHVNALMHNKVKTGVYIADGRDLGTAVFPDAELKFYMIADLDTRAGRRYDELRAQGKSISMEEVKTNLSDRDFKDQQRKADPLKKADDAILIDTSDSSFDEQVSRIADLISQRFDINTETKHEP